MLKKNQGFMLFLALVCSCSILVALRYLEHFPFAKASGLEQTFVLSSIVHHVGLLTAVGMFVAACGFLFSCSWMRRLWCAVIAACILTVWLVDTSIFSIYRFHFNGMVLQFLLQGQVVEFNAIVWLVWSAALLFIVGFFYAGVAGCEALTLRLSAQALKRIKNSMLVIVWTTLLATHGLHVYAAASQHTYAQLFKSYLPLFYPLQANSLMKKMGFEVQQPSNHVQSSKVEGVLHYPKQALQYQAVKEKTNVIFILVDALRKDMLNHEVMPQTMAFLEKHQGLQLQQHYSTGNSTRLGVFGLFYGLYPTYWSDVLYSRTAPILLDRMQSLDYQMGIFASSQLRYPEFTSTVFSGIPNVREETIGKTSDQRDALLTAEWRSWFLKRDKTKPHFSFLFYDAVHGYDLPDDYPRHFEPMAHGNIAFYFGGDKDPTEVKNRYKVCAHYVDSLIGQVLKDVEADGSLEQTLMIVTSDHGEEFNDEGNKYWGHGSAYSQSQMQVPMAMIGAGVGRLKTEMALDQRTSHYDIAPTLLKTYLGLTSDVADVSSGLDLHDMPKQERPYLIVGHYGGFGMLKANRVMKVDDTGVTQFYDAHYQEIARDPEMQSFAAQVFKEMNFFRTP